MTKTMLIDASHAEETRVAVLDGNRLDDFDIETADKRQIKGNIYLAKIVRVEPSLQAAFVEYGGNRHGFLAFAEIHPDYYQIPVADRQKLLEMEAEEARRRVEAEDAEDAAAMAAPSKPAANESAESHDAERTQALSIEAERVVGEIPITEAPPPGDEGGESIETTSEEHAGERQPEELPAADEQGGDEQPESSASTDQVAAESSEETSENHPEGADPGEADMAGSEMPQPAPEQVGGDMDAAEEARERRRVRILRQYKIQEVIHRRQVVLIQVIKEERGSKGAALTTYISLAGRYSVLMPNSPNGGGVSRKITAPGDRKRLKEVMAELEIPDGMGMIVRTAGANRPKPEIKRDCEYLLRLWDDIRERTMNSMAPALIYEEASLIKRTIRDVYTRDVDQMFVEGEEGYRAARDFMRMLMPSHVKKVRPWTEKQPLFARYQVEQMIEQVFQPTVQLKSGGYLVINQTEALVAIDVNSGRSTRERNIEDTALRTNLEAAEEVARQLRLRDLAGLIVVDFIDMEVRKHNSMVERKLKDALKNDRARIQVGSISHFGLLEMSRQRLRPSLAETMMLPCPHCEGTGHVRSAVSLALAVLRAIEDEGAKHGAVELTVHLMAEAALYIVNNKRRELAAIEERFGLSVRFVADVTTPGQFRIDKLRAAAPARTAAHVPLAMGARREEAAEEEGQEGEEAEERVETRSEEAAGGDEVERKTRRRRRRRRGRRVEGAPRDQDSAEEGEANVPGEPLAEDTGAGEGPETDIAAERETPSEVNHYTPELQPIILPEAEIPTVRRRRRPARRRRDEAASGAAPAEPTAPEEAPLSHDRKPVAEAQEIAPPAKEEPVFRDVADIFEAAERAEAERLATRRAGIAASATTAEPVSEPVAEPERAPEPAAESASEAAPEPAPEGAPEVKTQLTKPAPKAPVVQPIVIGTAEDAQVEPKRGWWRR